MEITVSEDGHARNFILSWEVVIVAQTQFRLLERIKCLLSFITEIKPGRFILNWVDLHLCLHPVGLVLVEVSVEDFWLWDDEIFVVDILIESLRIEHDHKLGMCKIIL